jgi:F-type H+-transporting ATPase subunit epsilon
MFDKPFKAEIVTPARIVFSGDVVSVSAPGVLGGFQVLFNHAPMISSIGIGVLTVKSAGGVDQRYATSGGFVEVRNNALLVLVESAERAEDIDGARAEASRDRAEKRLREKAPDLDVARAEAALQRALNRLRVAGRV